MSNQTIGNPTVCSTACAGSRVRNAGSSLCPYIMVIYFCTKNNIFHKICKYPCVRLGCITILLNLCKFAGVTWQHGCWTVNVVTLTRNSVSRSYRKWLLPYSVHNITFVYVCTTGDLNSMLPNDDKRRYRCQPSLVQVNAWLGSINPLPEPMETDDRIGSWWTIS